MSDTHLARLVAATDAGQVVTYKWLARELDVPVNHAKRLLFQHARTCNGVVATHCISGWCAAKRSHAISLVMGEANVALAKQTLSEVTGEHVYSVVRVDAKGAGVDGTETGTTKSRTLPESYVTQTDAFFDASPNTPNALRDNRHSPIVCALARRNDGPNRAPAKMNETAPKKNDPIQSKPAAKPAAKPATSKPASKPQNAFAGFEPADKGGDKTADTKTAPAVGGKKTAAASKPAAGKNSMAAMFAKAPVKKTPIAIAKKETPPSHAIADAIANDEDEDDEDDEEEEVMEAPRHRGARGGRKVTGLEDSDTEGETTVDPETMQVDPDPMEFDPVLEPYATAEPLKVSPAGKKAPAGNKEKKSPAPKKEKKSPAPKKEKPPPKEKKPPAPPQKEKAPKPSPKRKSPEPADSPAETKRTPATGKGGMDAFTTSAASGTQNQPNVSKQVKRQKKVITVMDEDTGEETTRTVWVDDAGTEFPPDAAPWTQPRPVASTTTTDRLNAPTPASDGKTNAKKPKKEPVQKKETPQALAKKPNAGGGIASFFGKK